MDDEGESTTFTPFGCPVRADNGLHKWNIQGGVGHEVSLLHGSDGGAVFGHVILDAVTLPPYPVNID